MLFGARAISRATPIVMMPLDDANCRLTMPVIKWLCCRDPLLYTFNIGLLKCGRSNSTNSNLLPMNLWTSLKGILLISTSTDERISLKWCKCFLWMVRFPALVFATHAHEITWRREYVPNLAPCCGKIEVITRQNPHSLVIITHIWQGSSIVTGSIIQLGCRDVSESTWGPFLSVYMD